jgi:polysaccharide pyruvyl transferase WcaK-like protein
MRIAVLGSYGEGNLGDEAILAGIRNRFKAAELVIFSHNPALSRTLHPAVQVLPMLPAGLRSYLKQFGNGQLKHSLQVLKSCERVLIGGGGIFYDSLFSQGRNPIKVWYWRTKLLQFYQISFELYCVGISKLQKAESCKLMAQIARTAKQISVRDQISESNLRNCGYQQDLQVLKDPAFDFPLPKDKRTYDGFTVGLALRKWQHQNQIFQQVIQELQNLPEKNFQLKLIPFSVGRDDDRIVLSEFKQSLPLDLKQRCELLEPVDPKAAFEMVAGLDLLIGMRLHSLIFAKLARVPYLPIYYDEKVQAILNSST